MMKKYFLHTLQIAPFIWGVLMVGIIASSILYATLVMVGVSKDISLLAAFIILIGLVLLSLLLVPTSFLNVRGEDNTFTLRLRSKRSNVKQKQSELLERLLQSIERLTQDIARQSLATPSRFLLENFVKTYEYEALSKMRQAAPTEELALNIERLTEAIAQQNNSFRDLINIQNDLLKHQQASERSIDHLAGSIVEQQENIKQLTQHLAEQQENIKQLTQHLVEKFSQQQSVGFTQHPTEAYPKPFYPLHFNKEVSLPIYTESGDIYFALTGQLIADYDRAIQLNPQDTRAYFNRGIAYYGLKEYQKALADFDRTIQLSPQYTNAYTMRGIAYADLKEYQKAIADYDRAIQLNPQDTRAYNNRGSAYYALKEYQKALADFDRAIQLDPNHTLAKNNREAAYRSLQRGT